jgi:hypothetical protein
MDYIIRRLALDYHEIQVLVPLAQQKVVQIFRLQRNYPQKSENVTFQYTPPQYAHTYPQKVHEQGVGFWCQSGLRPSRCVFPS